MGTTRKGKGSGESEGKGKTKDNVAQMPSKVVPKVFLQNWELFHEYTPAESESLAGEIAMMGAKLLELEDEFGSLKEEWKERINPLKERCTRAVRRFKNGGALASVECETTIDYVHNTLTVLRLDTGVEIKKRALTAEERQADLPIPDAPDAPVVN